MSVSIYNSYPCDKDFGVHRYTTESKMHHQQQHSATSGATVPRAKLDHVRRNLFGPVDRKECSRWVFFEFCLFLFLYFPFLSICSLRANWVHRPEWIGMHCVWIVTYYYYECRYFKSRTGINRERYRRKKNTIHSIHCNGNGKEMKTNNLHYSRTFIWTIKNQKNRLHFRFAQEELAKHQMSASQKWGFDFVRGCPIDDPSLYLWERVPPTNEIPEMYTLSRAAHMRPIEPIDRTPSKKRRNHQRRNSYFDMFDEMVAESNRYNPPKRNLLDLSFEDVDDGHTSSSSCDEESFEEEDNYDDNLAWMPNSQTLNSTPAIAATTTTTTITPTIVADATIDSNCDEADDGHQVTNAVEPATQSDTCSTLIKRSCDTSCNDNHMQLTSSHTTNATKNSPRILRNSPRIRERQYKITGKETFYLLLFSIFFFTIRSFSILWCIMRTKIVQNCSAPHTHTPYNNRTILV